MSRWRLLYTKQARKDARKLAASGLRPRAEELLKILEEDPFRNPPRFEKLVGDLEGACSRRINIQHRLVYEVDEKAKAVKVIRMDPLRVGIRIPSPLVVALAEEPALSGDPLIG